MPAPNRSAPLNAAERIRTQVLDVEMENIAELAHRARGMSDVITLWYGEGDLTTPDFIREAAKQALDEGMTFYVPDMHGLGVLRDALAAYQTRLHGREIGRDRSSVMPGGMQAVFFAMQLLLERGDNVVSIEPQWPNIRHAAHLSGGETRAVPLRYVDDDWRLDLDALFDACDARTRAIVYSTPSNPLGWTARRDELEALIDFSRRTGVWIISDEMYGRLYFEGDVAPSVLQIAEPEDLVLAVNGFSKAWAMTGWRIGWLTHPPSLAPALSAMNQYINSGTAGFIQKAASVAITEGEGFVRKVRERSRAGVDAAYEILRESNRIVLPRKPRGGMYITFQVDGEDDTRPICAEILEKAHVGLAPGWLFGASALGIVRMCVLRESGSIAEASRRIVDALR